MPDNKPTPLSADLLATIVCPSCKGELVYDQHKRALICRAERLVFSVTEDGIPILLTSEASTLDDSIP